MRARLLLTFAFVAISGAAHADLVAYESCRAPYDAKLREYQQEMLTAQLSFRPWDTLEAAKKHNEVLGQMGAQCSSLLSAEEHRKMSAEAAAYRQSVKEAKWLK